MRHLRFLPVALLALLPALFSAPPASAQPIVEEDWGSYLEAEVAIDTPSGTELAGGVQPNIIVGLDYATLGDHDQDGLEEIDTIVDVLEIAGTKQPRFLVMGIQPAIHPFEQSTGSIRESINPRLQVLDVDEVNAGDVSFDLYLEVQVLDQQLVLHAHDPVQLQGVMHRPPQPGDTMQMVGGPVTLYDDTEAVSGYTISAFSMMGYEPPPVGGIAESVAAGDAPAETSGSNVGAPLAAPALLAVLAGAAVFALAAGGWYARRRFAPNPIRIRRTRR